MKNRMVKTPRAKTQTMSETLLHYRRARKCTMTSRRLFRPGGCCFHPLIRVCALPRPRCALPFPNQDGPQQRTSPLPWPRHPFHATSRPNYLLGPEVILPRLRRPPVLPPTRLAVPAGSPGRPRPGPSPGLRGRRLVGGLGLLRENGHVGDLGPGVRVERSSPGSPATPQTWENESGCAGSSGMDRVRPGSLGAVSFPFALFLLRLLLFLSFFLSSLPPFLCYVVWWVGVGIDRVTDWDQTSRF